MAGREVLLARHGVPEAQTTAVEQSYLDRSRSIEAGSAPRSQPAMAAMRFTGHNLLSLRGLRWVGAPSQRQCQSP